MIKIAITTIDNPFNPITDYENWLRFDIDKGYYTNDYLGRIAKTSDSLSDEENDEEIERAIDEIIQYNPGMYRKVKEEYREGGQ